MRGAFRFLIAAVISFPIFLVPSAQAADGTGLSRSFKTLTGWTTPPVAVTSGACATDTNDMNIDWGSGGPCAGVTDNFVGYGTGYILAPYTGTVSFCSQTDDESYLKINNQVVINDPTAHGASTGQNCDGTGSLEMVIGNYYPIEAWVHEIGGGAVWRILWSWPGNTTKVVIPKANLYPSSFNPDTTPPTVSSVSSSKANGTYKAGEVIDIRVSFSEAVTVTGTPRITLETGSPDQVVNYSSGSGSSVLVFNYTVQAGDTASDLDYVGTSSLALNSGTIKDAAGNSATLTLPTPGATNSLGANKAIVIDTTAPTYSSSAVSSDGTQVILTYNEALSTTTAATSAFSVTAGGVAKAISSVSISGSTVILNLSSAIRASQIVSFTYSDPSGSDDANAVQDSAGNDAISLSSTSVTNNSTLSAAQAALSILSDISSKTYPYSQDLTFTPSGGSGSGAITYAVTNGSATGCTLTGSSSNETLTASTSGTCLITATKAGDGTYLSATSSALTFTFNKASQDSITITSTSASFGSDLSLTSSGGSTGGTFTYTKVSGDCTVVGSTLTPTSSGTCVIRSSLAENDNYLAAQSADTTINISTTSVSATITLEPGALTYRQAKSVSASSSVAGKVTFKVNGKVIPRCKKKVVAASATVICSYRPSTRGYVVITATLNPTDPSYIGTTTTTSRYFVGNRSGRRAG